MARLENFLKYSKILDFPRFRQAFEWNCGSTALSMVLAYAGHDIAEHKIMDEVAKYTKKGTEEGLRESGVPIEGLKAVAKKYGLKFKEGTLSITDLKENINKGWPTILLVQAWSWSDNPDWKNEWDHGHYTVFIGYDNKKVYFADPASAKTVYETEGGLMSRWHGWDDNDKKISRWGMTFMVAPKYSKDEVEEMT